MHARVKESFRSRSHPAVLQMVLSAVLAVLLSIPGSTAFAAVKSKKAAVSKSTASPTFIQKTTKLRIPFIANQGQIKDGRVKYYTQTFIGPAYVTRDGEIGYRFSSTVSSTSKSPKSWSLKESFIGAARRMPQGISKSPTQVNYFKGSDKSRWKSNIPTYDLISLGEIYPGIILSLKAHGKNIEKIFTIEPGSNPSYIRVEVNGSKKISVNNDDELVIANGSDQVRFSRPIAYQVKEGKKVPVPVAYSINARTYGFKVEKYENSLPLVIDPTMSYSTLLGGSSNDESTSISVDDFQIAFIAGETSSSDLVTAGTVIQSTPVGASDAFVAGISEDGASTLFVTYLGGDGSEGANDILVSDSDIIITGSTDSTDFPIAGSSVQADHGGSTDAFVAAMNKTGTVLTYSNYLGGSGDDFGNAIAVDSAGGA